jgi:hypothetical protein
MEEVDVTQFNRTIYFHVLPMFGILGGSLTLEIASNSKQAREHHIIEDLNSKVFFFFNLGLLVQL